MPWKPTKLFYLTHGVVSTKWKSRFLAFLEKRDYLAAAGFLVSKLADTGWCSGLAAVHTPRRYPHCLLARLASQLQTPRVPEQRDGIQSLRLSQERRPEPWRTLCWVSSLCLLGSVHPLSFCIFFSFSLLLFLFAPHFFLFPLPFFSISLIKRAGDKNIFHYKFSFSF